jgi:hypothetical protein
MTRAARVVWTSRAPPFSLRAWGWGGKMSQSPGLLRMGAEWVPVGAWGGRVVVSTMAGKRLRRWPRVSPLPRDPLRPTQTTASRGRGRGWGNIELLSRRWDARVCAIDNATPHPPFGHLVSFKRGPRQLPPRGAGFVGGGGELVRGRRVWTGCGPWPRCWPAESGLDSEARRRTAVVDHP